MGAEKTDDKTGRKRCTKISTAFLTIVVILLLAPMADTLSRWKKQDAHFCLSARRFEELEKSWNRERDAKTAWTFAQHYSRCGGWINGKDMEIMWLRRTLAVASCGQARNLDGVREGVAVE